MSQALLDGFHAAMLNIYQVAKRLKPPYHAPRFLLMVHEHGGKETADRLLATGDPSEGFTQLFLRGKDNLRVSVEYVVLQHPGGRCSSRSSWRWPASGYSTTGASRRPRIAAERACLRRRTRRCT